MPSLMMKLTRSCSPGFVATGGALKFAREVGTPEEALSMAAPVEVAIPVILKHINDAVKVDQATTFWSAMEPREVPF